MLSYFVVPTSTSEIVSAFNFALNTWGQGNFTQLISIVLAILFGLIVFVFVLKFFKHR